MIQINNLVVEVGKTEITFNNIKINKGNVVLVFGKNGSGKSVFLNSICNLTHIKKGEILFNGILNTNEKWKKYTSVFFGNEYLIPYLTCTEFFKLIFLISKKNIDFSIIQKYSELLDFEITEKKIINLSTGNQKKVGLISTLIIEPDLIIWDEPFANLDVESQEKLNALIQFLSIEKNITIIYSNHELSTFNNVIYEI